MRERDKIHPFPLVELHIFRVFENWYYLSVFVIFNLIHLQVEDHFNKSNHVWAGLSFRELKKVSLFFWHLFDSSQGWGFHFFVSLKVLQLDNI